MAKLETPQSGLDRVFLVLEQCAAADRALSLAELAERTGLPKSTLHRMCWKLAELGAVEATDGGFCVGSKLFALGGMHPEVRRLRALSMPFLHELCVRSGLMANLAVRCGDKALLVEEIYFTEGAPPRIPPKMIGTTLPLHATAIGKALIADLPGEAIERLAERSGLRPYTGRTIVRPGVLFEHLRRGHAARVIISSEEWRMGAAAVAAPVIVAGRTVAAVALVGPPDIRQLRRCADSVRGAAAGLARTLLPSSELQPL
jgi:DNA-binding IclR family transcriptional regulator